MPNILNDDQKKTLKSVCYNAYSFIHQCVHHMSIVRTVDCIYESKLFRIEINTRRDIFDVGLLNADRKKKKTI